jgi:SSS family transporter
MTSNFHWIDAATILLYLAVLTGIGIYFSKRQTSLQDFFLADRGMAWLPVGLSLMAALNSGIDFLMQPSATIKYGLAVLFWPASWLFLYPWVAKVTLPLYRRLNVYSAYEYMEHRFDVRVRTLAAGIFMLWRLGWMATALYVPCLAVSTASGGAVPLLPMVIVLGLVVTFYTMLGGIQAIIWTDVIQFCVMFGGLLATVLIVISRVPGGVSEIWSSAEAAGITSISRPIVGLAEADFMNKLWLFFKEPVTITGILVAAVVGRMTIYTCDQVMVQRFQTTRSLQGSKRAFIINAAGDTLWMAGLVFVGLALHAYFQHHPMTAGYTADQVFPSFLAQALPMGAIGLVIAAIFAASLSSIDSAINSCTSVVVVDFYNRLYLRRQTTDAVASAEDQRAQLHVSRAATLVVGIVGTVLACYVSHLGDLIEITNKVINSFTGALFGIYLLGMFSTRARSFGVLLGGLVGAAVTIYVAFFSSLSFLWPSTFGLLATVLVGFGVSVALPKTIGQGNAELTWRRVMQRPLRD